VFAGVKMKRRKKKKKKKGDEHLVKKYPAERCFAQDLVCARSSEATTMTKRRMVRIVAGWETLHFSLAGRDFGDMPCS
jgi:hypothetical protein